MLSFYFFFILYNVLLYIYTLFIKKKKDWRNIFVMIIIYIKCLNRNIKYTVSSIVFGIIKYETTIFIIWFLHHHHHHHHLANINII